MASKILGLPVRKASFPTGIANELVQPENATVLGLLHYGLEDHSLPGKKRDDAEVGFLSKFRKMVGLSAQD